MCSEDELEVSIDDNGVMAVVELLRDRAKHGREPNARAPCEPVPAGVRVVVVVGFGPDGCAPRLMNACQSSGNVCVISASVGHAPMQDAHYRICDVAHAQVDCVCTDPREEAIALAQWVVTHPARGLEEMVSLMAYLDARESGSNPSGAT